MALLLGGSSKKFLGEENGAFLINLPKVLLSDVAERLLELIQHADPGEEEGLEGACPQKQLPLESGQDLLLGFTPWYNVVDGQKTWRLLG